MKRRGHENRVRKAFSVQDLSRIPRVLSRRQALGLRVYLLLRHTERDEHAPCDLRLRTCVLEYLTAREKNRQSIKPMQTHGGEQTRRRTRRKHPLPIHILHAADRPAAKHDDDIALRVLRHRIRPLETPHEEIGDRPRREEIKYGGNRGENPRGCFHLPPP